MSELFSATPSKTIDSGQSKDCSLPRKSYLFDFEAGHTWNTLSSSSATPARHIDPGGSICTRWIRCDPDRAACRIPGHRWLFGKRKIDTDEPRGVPGSSDFRAVSPGRSRYVQTRGCATCGHQEQPHRLRIPKFQPAGLHQCSGECLPAPDLRKFGHDEPNRAHVQRTRGIALRRP